jgi:hypothetical protein
VDGHLQHVRATPDYMLVLDGFGVKGNELTGRLLAIIGH